MKTSLHTVLCIAIRLGAVLMAVGIVQLAPAIFLYPAKEDHYISGALWMAGAGLLVSFALWLWPDLLAWWAVSRSRQQILESSISAGQWQRIAFSVLGVWFFIQGIAACLARVVMMLVIHRRSAYGETTAFLSTSDWFWLTEHAATALAGMLLALGARGLAGLLLRVRSYPQPVPADVEGGAGITQGE